MRIENKRFALHIALMASLISLTVVGCGSSSETRKANVAKVDAPSPEAAAKAAAEKSRTEEAATIGVEAVIYGLPLILSDLTAKAQTNVVVPQLDAHAPVNQFGHMAKYPGAADKDIVRMNVDTLSSFAILDLAKEPLILSVPDTHGRYYLMPLIDAWTNVFASPGKRTTGTTAGQFAITGPNWAGTLPKGITEYKSPTNFVMIGGRTQANGPSDYNAVHAIQAQYKLTPLSAWRKPYRPTPGHVDPTVDMSPPTEQVEKMSSAAYFTRLAALLKSTPPPAADAAALAKFAKIGIVPGKDFDIAKLDPAVAKGLENSVRTTLTILHATAKETGKSVNGWNQLPKNIGKFGTDYSTRAVIALSGFGANLVEDAVYPSAFVDADGKPLNGANKYTLHYDKGQTPPASAFWSLTTYNAQSSLVDNPINRYSVAAWMPLKYNRDGSLDVYIQRESPGKDKEANWLPAADGEFSVTNRIYWPKPSVLDGSWKSPPIVKVR